MAQALPEPTPHQETCGDAPPHALVPQRITHPVPSSRPLGAAPDAGTVGPSMKGPMLDRADTGVSYSRIICCCLELFWEAIDIACEVTGLWPVSEILSTTLAMFLPGSAAETIAIAVTLIYKTSLITRWVAKCLRVWRGLGKG